MFDSIATQLYYLEQFANNLVIDRLNSLSFLSIAAIFCAGLLTSLTPCTLSMLPITIGYIGGYQSRGKLQAAAQTGFFVLGLATTLAGMGVVAASLGKVYGQIGFGLPILVSLVAIIMGLNLLEIVPLRFPSLGATDWIHNDLPAGVRSYLLGLTFGLVASPCSTPVLATLLAWVATKGNLIVGGGFLFAYTIGYVAPLILAGTFTATMKQLLELRQWSGWINPVSGGFLICFGTFSLLSRIV